MLYMKNSPALCMFISEISIKLFSVLEITQDEERAVCDCLNPFDVIAVELARHLFFGALPILGDVPEVRGDIN